MTRRNIESIALQHIAVALTFNRHRGVSGRTILHSSIKEIPAGQKCGLLKSAPYAVCMTGEQWHGFRLIKHDTWFDINRKNGAYRRRDIARPREQRNAVFDRFQPRAPIRAESYRLKGS